MVEHQWAAGARKLRGVDGFLAAVIQHHLGFGVKRGECGYFREGLGYIGAYKYSCYEHIALDGNEFAAFCMGASFGSGAWAFRDLNSRLIILDHSWHSLSGI